MNPNTIPKRTNLVRRYAGTVGRALLSPLARRVKYDFRTPQEKAAEKDPKSPSYKKNLVDRMVDQVIRGI